MKLIIIVGPPAVGKMTVGKELAKLTGMKLFHNHMTIELVNRFFDFGTEPFDRMNELIRLEMLKEISQSDLKGVIFTVVWAYNYPEDEAFIDRIIDIFHQVGAQVGLVELRADVDERLWRNTQADRLQEKPSKRNKEQSRASLLYAEERYRMTSSANEFADKELFKVDNTKIPASEVAQLIKNHFAL